MNAGNKKKAVYFASLKKCNEDCIFCVKKNDPEIEYLSTKECKDKIGQFAKAGWKTLYFDGGEPTLRSDLPELVNFAATKGFQEVVVMTNAVVLADKEKVRELLQATEQQNSDLIFSVSLHSHKKDVSEKIVQKKGTFEKTIKGIRNLADVDALFSLYHVINQYNYKDLPEFVDFVEAEFPEVINLTFTFIYPRGGALDHTEIFPKNSKVESYLLEAFEKIDKFDLDFHLATCGVVPLCFLEGYEKYTVNQQKEENPQAIKTIDSSKEEGYKLATDEFHKETKLKAGRCSLCLLNDLCTGVWDFYAEMYGVDELEPVVNPSRFKQVTIDFADIEDSIVLAKSKLELYEDIFFVDFSAETITKPDVKDYVDFIKWLSEKELNYLVKRPVPLLGEEWLEKYKRLGIPTTCKECLGLFEIEEGQVFFCSGVKAKKSFDDYSSKTELLREFKEDDREDSQSSHYKKCWLRDQV